MHGFLNLHKPAGVTSRDAINPIQRIVKPLKIGHAGTLDPLATGVLVAAVGQGTRLVEYVQRQRKEYVGVFLLGRTSDTEDVTGKITELSDAPRPTREAIDALLPQFRGVLLQRPPAYSALKVQGRRAYALARSGQEVDLAPRPIEIFDLTLVDYVYPRLALALTCSSGTYVRSLGRDIAAALGTGAVMAELVRTAIGRFRLAEAVAPDSLRSRADVERVLLPLNLGVSDLPQVALDDRAVAELAHGRPVELPPRRETVGEVAVFDAHGKLVALVSPGSGGLWRPARVFAGP